MGENTMPVRQFDAKHGVRQELNDFAFYLDTVFARHVRISGSPLVISTVCSKWADGFPSLVTTVQLSASTRTALPPILTIGSIASVIPGLSFGPVPGRP